MNKIKIYSKRKIASFVLATTIITGSGILKCNTLDSYPEFNLDNFIEDININNGNVTVDEVCKILYKLRYNLVVSFTDDAEPTCDYIVWTMDNQILTPDDNLSSSDYITKKYFLAFLYRYISKTNCVVTEGVTNILDSDIYYRDYISWAKKNKIMSITAADELVTKEEAIQIIEKFIEKYKLVYHKDIYDNEFFDVIDKNKYIPLEAKETLKIYVEIFKDYNINSAKQKEIIKRFKNIKFIKNENTKIDDIILGSYSYKNNTILYSPYMLPDTYQATIFHEGFHAITNGSKATGFCLHDGTGKGLTEGLNKLIETEYTDIQEKGGYDCTSALAAIVNQIVGPERLINYYIYADIDGFKEYILNIYIKIYDEDISLEKYNEIMKMFDCINYLEANNEINSIDKNYLRNLLDMLDELLYLNREYHIKDNKIMSTYQEKLLTEDYCYYKIENYFYNKNSIKI